MMSFNNGNSHSAGNNNGRSNALYARRSLRVIDPESDVSFLFVPPICLMSNHQYIYYIINYHPSLPLDPSSLIFHLVISYSIKYQSPLHVFIPYLHLAIPRLLVIVRGCISHNIFTSDNQQYQFLIHLH